MTVETAEFSSSGSGWLDAVWTVVREWVPERDRAAKLTELMWLWQCNGCRNLETLICDEFPEAEEAYSLLLRDNEQQDCS